MYRILHAPEFSIVAHFRAVTCRVRLNGFVNLSSSVFYEIKVYPLQARCGPEGG